MEKFKMRAMIISSLGLMLLMVGVTYSFFNYTKTGSENTLGTGRIYFNTTEGNALNITNAFPMTSTEAGNANLDSVTVGIVGDTNYTDGEEYVITLTGLNNTINGKEIPLNYIATYEAATGGTVGTSSNDYWNARNSKDATIYMLNTTGEIEEGKQVLVGYIDDGSTGVSGTLTIKAYIDADRIAITDTYNGPSATPNDNMGTTSSWVNGRTVFTTTEWNSLTSNPISFKIKAESQEGIWVFESSTGIETCPGCKFMYFANTGVVWTTWNSQNESPTVLTSGLYDNYEDLISTTNKNYFLGVKLNNNHEVTNAYVCGVKDDVPFCLEGTAYGTPETAATYTGNKILLQGSSLYNNTCTAHIEGEGTANECEIVECGPWDNSGSISADADSLGTVSVGIGSNLCGVSNFGAFGCNES